MRRGWEERWEGKEKGESRRIVKSIGLKNKLKERGVEAWREEKREEEERWNWEWTEERRQEKARDKKIRSCWFKAWLPGSTHPGGNFGSFIRKREPETPRPAVRVERESCRPESRSTGSRAARSSGGVARCGSKAQPDSFQRHSAQKFRSSDSQRKLFTKPPTTTHWTLEHSPSTSMH